ncbi:MAG TPA: hypothetical protein VLG47_08100 [Candidatus Saccharimonadales bacterium]|nr:hypothetical protein [Candidatus Saccharimonadales bacterium]
MRQLATKLKPANGFSYFVHLGLLILLPLTLFVLVRMHFIQLAFILILLSKWRMFAVRPRFWPANIRANSIDLIVGFSVLLLMTHTDLAFWQGIWAVLYAVWLVAIKPGSSILMTSVQASIGFLAGLTALFYAGAAGALWEIVLITALVCYLSARHFFDSFEEPYAKLLSYMWGYFGAALVWLLGHWLLFYGVIAQPTVLLVAVGYGLGALYYLDHFDKLSTVMRRQFIFIMIAIVAIVLALSNWGHKIV